MASAINVAVANNEFWPHDLVTGGHRAPISDIEVTSSNWNPNKMRLECYAVAIDEKNKSLRIVVPCPGGLLFPQEQVPFCYIKFSDLANNPEDASWWACMRIKVPGGMFLRQDGQSQRWENFAAIQVDIDSVLAGRFHSSPIQLKNILLETKFKIQIEHIKGDMTLPGVTWAFPDEAHFRRLHQYGVNREFEIEEQETEQFNHRRHEFGCWFLKSRTVERRRTFENQQEQEMEWTMIVDTRGAPDMFPPMLERCEIGLVLRSKVLENLPKDLYIYESEHKSVVSTINAERRGCRWFFCSRVENPPVGFDLGKFNPKRKVVEKTKLDDYATFKVTLPAELVDENSFLAPEKPLLDFGDPAGKILDGSQTLRITLPSGDAKNAKKVRFWRRLSKTTTLVEIAALAMVGEVAPAGDEGKRYLMEFKNPGNLYVNIFTEFPDLLNYIDGKSSLLSELLEKASMSLDKSQQEVFKSLKKIPCGIKLLSAPSGTGKTHFALVLLVMLLAPSKAVQTPSQFQRAATKILFLSDTNQTADDLANKIQKALIKLRLSNCINVIRARNWNHERIPVVPNGSDEQPAHKAQPRKGVKGELLVDSLREFCLRCCKTPSTSISDADGAMRESLCYIDVIVTTPTGAAKLADAAGSKNRPESSQWLPDVVIVDNASRMKEASSLVSLTSFPHAKMWMFLGSNQQTRPFVHESLGPSSKTDYPTRQTLWPQLKNLAQDQLRVSTLARWVQHKKEEVQQSKEEHVQHSKGEQELRTLYGVFGGLHIMRNLLFFGGNLELPENLSTFPDTLDRQELTENLRKYLVKNITMGQNVEIPRVLVSIENAGQPRVLEGSTSPFHAEHQAWIMTQVKQLLPNLRADRSIMIITPYAEAARQYRREIKDLLKACDETFGVGANHRKVFLDARTIDASQGKAADIVFIDFVRTQTNAHLDDVFRLCVGFCLARHMEVIVLHPSMRHELQSNFRSSRILNEMSRYCQEQSYVVSVSKPGVLDTPARPLRNGGTNVANAPPTPTPQTHLHGRHGQHAIL